MMEILSEISTTPTPQMDQLETQVYHAFGIAGNLTIKGKTLEKILLEVLEKRGIKRWWDLSQKDLLSDAALGTLCDALGKMGTKESISALTKLGKTREGPWTPRLKEAVKKIEQRMGASTK
jgi:hypothetical protein